jgi:hypothetical protein
MAKLSEHEWEGQQATWGLWVGGGRLPRTGSLGPEFGIWALEGQKLAGKWRCADPGSLRFDGPQIRAGKCKGYLMFLGLPLCSQLHPGSTVSVISFIFSYGIDAFIPTCARYFICYGQCLTKETSGVLGSSVPHSSHL